MRVTGFSEITPERAAYAGEDPWFVEIALTGKCNFKCGYCNRFSEQACKEDLFSYFDTFESCRHIQVTGGEPTVHRDFDEIMAACRAKAKRVGLSTNGTAKMERYLECGADMFSISLDDYNMDKLVARGYRNPEKVVATISRLAEKFYVDVGVVIDSDNVDRVEEIIAYILSLGVSDVKLSTSTKDELIPKFEGDYSDYPILNYRVRNFQAGHQMRGWPGKRCRIAENDVTIVGSEHYPCLIYFREGGAAIGRIGEDVMEQRKRWADSHLPQKDRICRKYCMDFKCEFNQGSYEGKEGEAGE